MDTTTQALMNVYVAEQVRLSTTTTTPRTATVTDHRYVTTGHKDNQRRKSADINGPPSPSTEPFELGKNVKIVR
jgi:hypothetical protein